MKKMISAMALSLFGLAQSAMAFQIEANAIVTPNLVTATACNYGYPSTIVCNVTSSGFVNAGFPITATATLVLAPGMCDNAYVYANYPYYFVSGSGTANCSFY